MPREAEQFLVDDLPDSYVDDTFRQMAADQAFVELLGETQQTEAFAELVQDISEISSDPKVDFEQVLKVCGISFVTAMTVVAGLVFHQVFMALVLLAAISQVSGVSISSLLDKR